MTPTPEPQSAEESPARLCKYCARPPLVELAPIPEAAPKPTSILIRCDHCGGCVCCVSRVDIAPNESVDSALALAQNAWGLAQQRACFNHQSTQEGLASAIRRRAQKKTLSLCQSLEFEWAFGASMARQDTLKSPPITPQKPAGSDPEAP